MSKVLADRMRAAGMMTIEEMLAGAPLDRFMKHAGVSDLETYGQWLEMKCREFLTMQAKRDLDKEPEDDMYEWVLAHAAVFQEARINFKAASDTHIAALSTVTAERDRLRHSEQVLMQSRNAHRDERDQLRAEVEGLRNSLRLAEHWCKSALSSINTNPEAQGASDTIHDIGCLSRNQLADLATMTAKEA